MSGSIQMLRSDLPLDPEQATLMEIVLRESTRLNRTIEEFLFYSKPVAPIPQEVDLAAMVADTVTLFRNSSELKPSHAVTCRREGEDFVVRGDPDQLRQVLLNLLRNSAQAMPEGGPIEVVVGPPDGEGVGILVRDRGPGFAEGSQARLWEPFHGSSTKGFGLGLAIVYQIVREHRGRLVLGRRAGGGAEVALWLPRQGPLLEESPAGDPVGMSEDAT
jgi:signal transduction histidine kinase